MRVQKPRACAELSVLSKVQRFRRGRNVCCGFDQGVLRDADAHELFSIFCTEMFDSYGHRTDGDTDDIWFGTATMRREQLQERAGKDGSASLPLFASTQTVLECIAPHVTEVRVGMVGDVLDRLSVRRRLLWSCLCCCCRLHRPAVFFGCCCCYCWNRLFHYCCLLSLGKLTSQCSRTGNASGSCTRSLY